MDAQPQKSSAAANVRPQPGAPNGTLADEAKPQDFVSIVDRFESGLLRYVSRMLSPTGRVTEECEDIVQETFLRLHRQIHKDGLDSIQNLNAWLHRVAHNLSISALRKRQREQRAHETVREDERHRSDDSLDGLGEMVRRAACDRALEELGRLPDENREVLLLKVIQGMTLREIGEVLGLTPGNVAYRVNQGLSELSRRLKDAGIA